MSKATYKLELAFKKSDMAESHECLKQIEVSFADLKKLLDL